MAKLATVTIPLVSTKPRFYPEGWLPTKPSDKTPVNGKILSRDITNASYVVCLADGQIINDIAVENVLGYVSAFELERYELADFRDAAEALKAVDAEEDRLAVEREEARTMRKKMKGLVVQRPREFDESSEGSLEPVQPGEVGQGRHGRARPTYTHLYHPAEMRESGNQLKTQRVRRRRKRHPVTGKLMPLSDRESDNERPRASSSAVVSSNDTKSDKRRRRKRDAVTGELLPLSPENKTKPPSLEPGKRQRRRRHPLTGELMPLGWKNDPEAPIGTTDTSTRRENGVEAMSPGMESLRLSIEPNAKRVKIDFSLSESSSSQDGRQGPGIMDVDMNINDAMKCEVSSSENAPAQAGAVIRGEDESETDESIIYVKSKPRLFTPRAMVASPGASSQAADTRPTEPSRNTLTAIMHSSPPRDLDDDDMDDDLADDEWFIEAILAHHLSDPLTHAPEYGADPVMLYKVKWEGSNELTWEPLSSFPDPSIIEDYERRVGMNSLPPKIQQKKDVVARRQMISPLVPTAQATQVIELDVDDEDIDEKEYRVEAILAHHLSDPETHKATYGRKPIMLYLVKWAGHKEPTWETAKSFTDPSFVNEYRKRVGLLPLSH
ncbi:Hypothetical protein R9X50_00585200 [Acrodontium crateriforme]|uniref:Chromo domain-containing protein n=1 Tax=Acrodontium crateriforme TaxID=150365 RepID=A0AAQ3M807_9PEZI|nr:Hypothetical protein R9X50_00585200 [Acrodontium crateriforme]